MNNNNKQSQQRQQRRKPRKARKAANRYKKKNQSKNGNPPIAIRSKNTILGPTIKNVDSQTVRIKHKEFVKAITPNTNQWHLESPVLLNPGLPESFPWLNATARNYESYRIEDFVIEYVPTVPTTTAGSISMFIDYDAADAGPATETEFKNNQGATTVPIWQKMTFRSMKEQLNKAFYSRYTRTEPLPDNLDIKTYDFGKLFIATEGATANSKVGDLYLRYDIVLLTPQLGRRDVRPGDNLQHIKSSSTSPMQPLLGAQSMGVSLAAVEGDGLKFEQEGKYLIEYVTSGTGIQNYQFTPGFNDNNKLLVGLLGPNGTKIVNNVLYSMNAGQKLTNTLNSGQLSATDVFISKISDAQYQLLVDDIAGIYPVQ